MHTKTSGLEAPKTTAAGSSDYKGIYYCSIGAVIAFSQPVVFLQNRMVHILVPLTLIIVFVAMRASFPLMKMKISPLILALVILAGASTFWTVSIRSSVLELTVLICVVISGAIIGNALTIERICSFLAWAGVAILAVSLITALAFPAYGLQQGDYQSGSLRGIYSHRNVLAFTLVVGFVGALGMKAKTWPIKLGLMVALWAGILAANSSTAVVCGVTAILALVILKFFSSFRRGYRLAPLLLASPVVLLTGAAAYLRWESVLALLGRDSTFTGRTFIWDAVDQVSDREPIFGYGWGGVWGGSWVEQYVTSMAGFRVPHAHSGYLDLRIQVGWLGFSLFLTILLALLVRGSSVYLSANNDSYILVPLLIIVFAVYNVVETRITLPLSLFVLVVLGSHLLAVRHISEEDKWRRR